MSEKEKHKIKLLGSIGIDPISGLEIFMFEIINKLSKRRTLYNVLFVNNQTLKNYPFNGGGDSNYINIYFKQLMELILIDKQKINGI